MLIKEGKAEIDIPVPKKLSKKMPVFYNPVMAFNREMTVRLIRVLGRKNLRVALPLAGTGIRGIRLSLETEAIEEIHYNDNSERAVIQIKKNLDDNDVKGIVSCQHASSFLLSSKGFDYIDIDPFGSPNSFLDASIKRLSRDSILAVTATDTAPLSGTYPKACIRKYWAKPLREDVMHEVALRILIRKVQLIGAQYERALIPILSYSKDHYLRIFFKVNKGKSAVDEVLKEHQYLSYCSECMKREFTSKSISDCHFEFSNAGPMWTGYLNDSTILEKIDESGLGKDSRFVSALKEEVSLENMNIFIDVHRLYKRYDLGNVKKTDEIIDILKKEGYNASRSHFSKVGIRTDAKIDMIIRLLS